MAPKLRRPAAAAKAFAVGAAKAKAKAGAKAKARARAKGMAKAAPRRRTFGVRRRPAQGDRSVSEIFRGGEEVEAVKLPLEVWRQGQAIVVSKGNYWEEEVKLSGIVKGLKVNGRETLVQVELTGSPCESLVKWKGSNPRAPLDLDVCLPGCAKLSKDGLVHMEKVMALVDQNREAWMDNLQGVVAPEDELAELRRRAELAGNEGEPGAKADEVSDEESAKESKKKKKAKKKDKKKKEKVKVSGTKGLKQVFSGTGLDPDPSRRKAIKRRAKKLAKSKEAKSAGSSEDSEILQDQHGEPRRRGRSRAAFRRGSKGEEGLEGLPWSLDREHHRADARELGESTWSNVERGDRVNSSSFHSILETGPTATCDGTVGQGKSNLGLHSRPPIDGEGSFGKRCADAANEEPRTDSPRRTLFSCPEAGASATGVSQHVQRGGDHGSFTTTPCRPESSSGLERMGKEERLGQKRRWRPRTRTKQSTQRTRKEQKRPPRKGTEGGCKEGLRKRSTGEQKGSETPGPWKGEEIGPNANMGVGAAEMAQLTPQPEGLFHLGAEEDARRDTSHFLQGFSTKGRSLGDIAENLLSMFNEVTRDFKPLHGMTKCSGSIFPLPEDLTVIQQVITPSQETQAKLLQMLCIGLNSYYGAPRRARSPLPSASVAALKALARYSSDVGEWSEKFEGESWDDYFAVKSVDYQGEEVKVAKSFCWQNLEPALPEGIGSIPLEEVCELGTRDFVLSFEEYLVPEDSRVHTRPPRVMVNDSDWEEVCRGLLERGVCALLPKREVCRVQGQVLLNGLFGVSKSEYVNGCEVMRLIMNLVPVNKMCRPLGGDVSTLPSWSGMSPFLLEDNQVILMSSEDIRCFFYLFSIPRDWWPYMCFGREVSSKLHPCGESGPFFLCSRVLPMGFLNSVSIAQHVHRRIARLALHSKQLNLGPQNEIRKDLSFSTASSLYRIYLDNFNLLIKVEPELASRIQGTVALEVDHLREVYLQTGLPRHPKKSVQQQPAAEIQGAIVDGVKGLVRAKPEKILKYIELAVQLLQMGDATQRQMQIICGGFVYCCMFRRALLGALNAVWQFIVSFSGDPPFIRRKLPLSVQSEILRFIMLVPLAQMNLRAPLKGAVTASDASEYGGGFCISHGLTPMGCHAASCEVRGDLPEIEDHVQVLTVGLFDGIGALRVSADALILPMAGHVSSEVNVEGRRVLEAQFPDTLSVGNVEDISDDMVKEWALRYSNVGIVLVGGGPPCQGVSGLNSDRKGSLRDARSNLFVHVPRVYKLCQKHFRWAQVHHLMESVASMDEADRIIMSKHIGTLPWRIDPTGISLCRRPRLYWISWELQEGPGVTITPSDTDDWHGFHVVDLKCPIQPGDFLASGWSLLSGEVLPTFTISRPRDSPGNRPAGLGHCQKHEIARWVADRHRYPPYVYRDRFCLSNSQGEVRLPNIEEKEVIMGFPVHYTAPCLPKQQQQGQAYLDARHTLIGNSWHVPVITWLLSQIFGPLGLTPIRTLEEVVKVCTPGTSRSLPTFLRRLPFKQQRKASMARTEQDLAKRLINFVSVKGEDLLLQAATENSVRFHRLRSSVPARLWRWRVVCGWPWQHTHHHINTLELRAVLTSLQWRLERRKEFGCRFIHLTDSLVCLHSLTRGRSSSRKLRGILSRINALLLAADVRPVWAYVSTKQNPADRPSRRPVHKTCQKRKSI